MASQTHSSLVPTNSTAVLVKSVRTTEQVTASMLPAPSPVLSSSTQSVLHWVGAKVGLDEVGVADGPRVGSGDVGAAVGAADMVGDPVGDCVGEHVALQHDVLQLVITFVVVPQRFSSSTSEQSVVSGYIGSPVQMHMLLGDSDGPDVVGADVGASVGVDVVGDAVGAFLIWQHVHGQSASAVPPGSAHVVELALASGQDSCSSTEIAQQPITLVGTAVGDAVVGAADGQSPRPASLSAVLPPRTQAS